MSTMSASTDRNELRVLKLIKSRVRHREAVTEYTQRGYWPLMAYLQEGSSLVGGYSCPGNFLSLDEAVSGLARQVKSQRKRIEINHWSACHVRLAAYRDRLVVARYFARFGKHIWQQEAA